MTSHLFLLTIFFVTVTSQNYGLLHFSQDAETLSKCLEDYASINNLRTNENSAEIKFVIDSAATQFSRKTKIKEDVNSGVASLIDSATQLIDLNLMRNATFRTQLETSVKKALLNCAEKEKRNESSDQLN